MTSAPTNPSATAPPTAPEILSDHGPVAAALTLVTGHEFESRPEQIEMATAVELAFQAARDSSSRFLFVEAGTGVGKSFAYLVPAMLRCMARGERVVVATNTISLQEQLISKDVPFLQSVLSGRKMEGSSEDPRRPEWVVKEPKAVLVKGRGNYVSIRRLRLASKRQHTLLSAPGSLRSLHAIEDWAEHTLDGTLSTLPALESGWQSVWDKVQSDSGNCMGRACPTYDRCFYQAARAELEGGNLFVCNHAIFFADLALRSTSEGEVSILPDYHHVVLDEAHNVEDVASEHFGASLTEARVHFLLTGLYHARTGKGLLPSLVGSGENEITTDMLDKACHAVLEAESAARGFFDDLARLFRSGELRSGRISTPGLVDNPLTPALGRLSTCLKILKDSNDDAASKFELNSFIQRAEEIATTADRLVNQKIEGCVYWIESSDETDGGGDRARGSRTRLACAPVEVAPLLAKHLFGRPLSVVLTSATLATAADRQRPDPRPPTQINEATRDPAIPPAFRHIASRLGCGAAGTLQLGSPFDYASQVRVYIEANLPDPRAALRNGEEPAQDRDRDGLSPMARAIFRHVQATRGGAFVLFNSFAALRAAAGELEGLITEAGLPLLVQGISGSRAHILDAFRANPASVLFGAASFWQGVDVRGDGLRNVIITRLPFEPPDRPLTQARLDLIQERGGNPFIEDSLPRAIIRFKQGFGRLIRSKTDTGRVVVLDPRIVTARYGRLFIGALPSGVRVESTAEDD